MLACNRDGGYFDPDREETLLDPSKWCRSPWRNRDPIATPAASRAPSVTNVGTAITTANRPNAGSALFAGSLADQAKTPDDIASVPTAATTKNRGHGRSSNARQTPTAILAAATATATRRTSHTVTEACSCRVDDEGRNSQGTKSRPAQEPTTAQSQRGRRKARARMRGCFTGIQRWPSHHQLWSLVNAGTHPAPFHHHRPSVECRGRVWPSLMLQSLACKAE